MRQYRYLLIDPKVLPPVFENVIHAKDLLASGQATSAAQAAKMAGISRSAFYKYKDFVFKYSYEEGETLHLNAVLSDRAGVFSALTAAICDCGANIVTLSQGLPENGLANVSLSLNNACSPELLLQRLQNVEGVISVKRIKGGNL
ncbi:MAG: ACT domain-containing protein [Clostridia bacterium]|nr:ACT domain-containing protein [Clostridia bacterium]